MSQLTENIDVSGVFTIVALRLAQSLRARAPRDERPVKVEAVKPRYYEDVSIYKYRCKHTRNLCQSVNTICLSAHAVKPSESRDRSQLTDLRLLRDLA